jgi:hypothetical protein
MSKHDFDDDTIAIIFVRSFAVFMAIMVLALSYLRGGMLATASGRASGILRVAVGLLLLAHILGLSSLLVALLDKSHDTGFGPVGPSFRLSTAWEFIETQGLGLLLVAQFELATGLRRIEAGDGAVIYSARGIDLWGRGSFIIATLLNIIRLICSVVLLSNDEGYYRALDTIRALIYVDFALKLWLAIVALSALICTAKVPLVSFAKLRAFLSLAAFLVLVRVVFDAGYAGHYNIGALAGNTLTYYQSVTVARNIFDYLMLLLALPFILAALGIGKGHGLATGPKYAQGVV